MCDRGGEPVMAKWKKIIQILLLAAITARLAWFCIPFLSNAIYGLGQAASIRKYQDSMENTGEQDISGEFDACGRYNNRIAKGQKTVPFHYSSRPYTDKEYESLLDLDGDGVMGYIEIPSVDIYLPVGHGTSDVTLDTMAGHMHGTSLITGGESTHAVITAHTGLQSAKLFDNVDRLETGDDFFIYVLGETHRYVVDDIRTVLPEDADQYLGVEDGKDYVTLYTCTPYGVNDHRLLVRGTRRDAENSEGDTILALRDHGIRAVLETILFAGIPVTVLVTGMIFLRRRKR